MYGLSNGMIAIDLE